MNLDSDASSDTNQDESTSSYVKQFLAEKEAEDKVKLEKFKIMRAELNWENEEERHAFLDKFTTLTEPRGSWRRHLPDLRDSFQPEQVEWLIMETLKERVKRRCCEYTDRSAALIDVIAKSGYKIEPDLDEAGDPVSRRATPLHYAVAHDCSFMCQDLLEVYGCDVNYVDETGLTHLHAAISLHFINYVEDFVERGHASWLPELETDTVEPPLHWALNPEAGSMWSAELLIAGGADPNLANRAGSTPLHVICQGRYEDWARSFFGVCDEVGRLVEVDARDKQGRTPLQWAVASLMPDTVDLLLDRGADLANFVFPDETYFARDLQRIKRLEGFEVGLAADTLDIVERLETRGYRLDQEAALTIMKVFAELGMFKKPADPRKYSLDDPYFVGRSKKLMVSPRVSLYKFCRMPPKEAMRLATFEDCARLACSSKFWRLREEYRRLCGRRLCETVARQFFRRWALPHLATLTRQQHGLSIYDCEKIVDGLENVDLWCVCMAATGQVTDDEEMKRYLEDKEAAEPYDHDHEECKRRVQKKSAKVR